MIIRSGFKVFPSEIENVFLKHEAIEACAVVSVHDKIDNTAPFAYIKLKNSSREEIETIVKELEEAILENGLPPYFTPVGFEVRNSFPLTPVGKIDYRQLEKEAEKTRAS